MPNFFMPMVPPGQQGQHRGGIPVQQNQQQPIPLMQQQMVPCGWMYRYPPGRNVGEVPMGSIFYDIGDGMQLYRGASFVGVSKSFEAKVVEAMGVLRNVGGHGQGGVGSPTDQLAALSLNDDIVS
ncbi:unnamed protein product [Lactuca saligna]|uniref:Uncharacterized protein n=1 Tax=Lactuca saligna TaxID=75948 RepID=A0AA35ZAD5_LACSI|nr:unnamed protein product [Lactuca saligna]